MHLCGKRMQAGRIEGIPLGIQSMTCLLSHSIPY